MSGISSSHTTPGVPVITPSPLRLGVKGVNMQRMVEEMRQHIAKLKLELDSERAKNKQLHRDKISEMKQMKEACDKEKEHALHTLDSKLLQEKHISLQKQKDTLNKERDQEIRQILRTRDDEIKQNRLTTSKEKEEAVKVALELQKKAMAEQHSNGGPMSHVRPGSGNSVLIIKLQREIKVLKENSKDLEERLKLKTESEADKSEQLRKIHINYETQIAQLIQDSSQPLDACDEEVRRVTSASDNDNVQAEGAQVDPSTGRTIEIDPSKHGADLNCDNLGGTWTIKSGSPSPGGHNTLDQERDQVSTYLRLIRAY